MDTLIRQIAQTFENNDGTERPEALGKAMKEIVFSGLNRCGFFKTFIYLPGLDRMENGIFYTCFLYSEKSGDPDPDPYLPYIGDELNAMGIRTAPVRTKNGFRISPVPGPGEDQLTFEVFISQKELKDPLIRISYQQTPLPYEYRSMEEVKGSLRTEILKGLEALIKAENSAEKKKGPQKARNPKKKKADKPDDNWLQPSLFDF